MKKVVIWIALSLWSVMTVFAGETRYLFSYFINDSKDGLHLAYSYDGLNWLPLHGGRSELDRPEWWQVIPAPCRGER